MISGEILSLQLEKHRIILKENSGGLFFITLLKSRQSGGRNEIVPAVMDIARLDEQKEEVFCCEPDGPRVLVESKLRKEV